MSAGEIISRRPRVLLLTPYAPPHLGGISSFVQNLQSALENDDVWEVSMLSRSRARRNRATSRQDSALSFVARSLLTILATRPDVVHAHAHWYTLVSAAALRRLGFRIKIVFSFHTMPAGELAVWAKSMFSKLLAQCHHITFVSRSLEQQVRTQVHISAPFSILQPGVPLPPLEGKSTSTRQTVGFAGPLVWKEKVAGVEILLQAVSILRNDLADLKLLVAGSGPLQESLARRVSELGLLNMVSLLGRVGEMSVFWRSIDIYAHISLQEGLPLSLLEAMSWAKPIVAVPVGGIPEVVRDGHNGILVPPEPSAIADGLRRLLVNPEFAKMVGVSGRRTVENHYGLERLAREARGIYEPALRRQDDAKFPRPVMT